MRKFSRIYKMYEHTILSAVMIVLCLIGVFVGIIPAGKKIVDELDLSQQLSTQLDGLERKVVVLDGLDEAALRQNLAVVLSAVPGEKSLPTVFSTVEGVANEAGVTVTDMNLAGVGGVSSQSAAQSILEKKLGTRVLPFTVTVQGPISAIQQFIMLTPTVRRLLRLRTFSITFPKQEEVLRVNLEMDAFYEPFPTTIGTLGSVVTPLSEKEQELVGRVGKFTLVSGEAGALPPPALGLGKTNPFSQ